MNRLSHALLAAIAATLVACDTAPETPATSTEPLTAAQQQAQAAQLKLTYGAPEQIDSSAYVVYPLVMRRNRTEKGIIEKAADYSSGSRYEEESYWNLVFYDPTTGTSHLLDAARRMVIYGYEPRSTEERATNLSALAFAKYVRGSFTQVDKLLYYSVCTLDYNRDGKLTAADPNYLFISDKAGHGFRQVSPEAYNVDSWQLLRATNKILLQATADTNHDLEFNEKDTEVLLVYDLATGGPAREVLTEDFKTTIKNTFHAQWFQKPGPQSQD